MKTATIVLLLFMTSMALAEEPVLRAAKVSTASIANMEAGVDMMSMSAVHVSDVVKISWHTRFERRNIGFEIERRTQDATTWETIGYVHGSRTTASPKSYEFTDLNAPDKVSYYRLKQVSDNSQSIYTSVMTVVPRQVSPSFNVTKVSNAPMRVYTTLSIAVEKDEEVTVSILDVHGKELSVVLDRVALSAGHHIIPFNAKELPAGAYLLKMASADGIRTRTLLKS